MWAKWMHRVHGNGKVKERPSPEWEGGLPPRVGRDPTSRTRARRLGRRCQERQLKDFMGAMRMGCRMGRNDLLVARPLPKTVAREMWQDPSWDTDMRPRGLGRMVVGGILLASWLTWNY